MAPPSLEQLVALATDDPDADLPPAEDDDGDADHHRPTLTLRWSATEVLRNKDFAECTPGELAEAHRLMADIRMVGALRRSRRQRRSTARTGRPDIRRTVHTALRSGGDVARLERLAPGTRRRRVVLLLDVSGSMEAYARALLRFAHVAVAARRQVEAFALGTRLTRLTRELSSRDPDEALARAAAASVTDWSGGTRLGEGLRAFNDEWGCGGWPAAPSSSCSPTAGIAAIPMTSPSRWPACTGWRTRWCGSTRSRRRPATSPWRGMAAALPHVDEFVEGHSLASLEQLAEVLS